MERFDELLKNMADKEDCIVPEGFDARLQKALDGLPPRAKKAGLGAVKGALIAVAVCAALVCTAFAASPGLRGLLAEALGGFAPYAQEQEGEAYIIDGIEFRVVSALADDFTVRAYMEARELEGDRLSKLTLYETGTVFGLVDIPPKDVGDSEGIRGGTMSGTCLGYDAETKTALLAVTSWGRAVADNLSGIQVRPFSLSGSSSSGHQTIWENSDDVVFPVEVKPIPSLIAGAELADAFQAEEVRISSLGLSVIFKDDQVWPQFAGSNMSAGLADGTLADAPWEGGQGSFGTYGTQSSRKVLIWNFREPVEVEQIQSITLIGRDGVERTFPVELP